MTPRRLVCYPSASGGLWPSTLGDWAEMLINVGESPGSDSIRMLMLHALIRAECYLTIHELKQAARWTLQVRAISLATTQMHLDWLRSHDYVRECWARNGNGWLSVWQITATGREVHHVEENRLRYSVVDDLMRIPVIDG